jgi:flagellar biosynthetic protein FliQ
MTPDTVVDLFREAIFLIMTMASVMIVPALVVGLIISMFQAATQINEQTLSFFPRLLTTLGAMVIAGPWLLAKIMDFTTRLAASIPLLIG